MFKKLCLATISSLVWIQANSFAATTLSFQNPKPTQPTATVPGAPIPPSEFAGQVKATNAQNHAQFKQQLDQQKNELSRPKIPSLSEVQNMSQTPPPPIAPAETQSAENPAVKEQYQNRQANVPAAVQQPAVTNQNLSQPVMPSPPPPQQAAPPPAPVQNQPYTGFAPAQQPAGGAGTQQQNNSGGGFNIKY